MVKADRYLPPVQKLQTRLAGPRGFPTRRLRCRPSIYSQNEESSVVLTMRNGTCYPALPPVSLRVPDRVEDALAECAHGESPPDIALMQLLVVSPTEEAGVRALGTAIWDALENRETHKAERLGTMYALWEAARRIVHAALR